MNHRSITWGLVLVLAATLVHGAEARGQEGLKVYISADMEGITGVVTGEQLGPSGFEKEVALKLVPHRLTRDDSNSRALINEARIGGQLRHPNIVEVYELDQAEDTFFVAMELVRGKTLGELLGRCRETGAMLPRCVVLEIAMQIASGLNYAHTFRTTKGQRASLVHRDLKPQNIMIDAKNTVKIMDFGAFVQILPGTDGLVHISQLANRRVTKVTDIVREGEKLKVKVLEIGRDGKIRLSHKAVLNE